MPNKNGGKSTNLIAKKGKTKNKELSEEDLQFKLKQREDLKKTKDAAALLAKKK